MSDYEGLRQQHLALAAGLTPQFIDRIGWPASRLAGHRIRQLRQLAQFAAQRSPWYRKQLAGTDLENLDENALAGLPVLTKADLMDNFDDIVTEDRLSLRQIEDHLETVSTGSYLLDRYTAMTSGGSTGRRGVFVYDWEEWAVFWLSLYRYLLQVKRDDPELAARPAVMANVSAAHFSHGTAAMARTFSGPVIANVRFPVTLSIDEIVAGLNRTQPDFILCYSSALLPLAHEAMAGRLRIAPLRIVAGADPLLPEIRAAAERAWGIRVHNWWGASEGGGLAVGCDAGSTHLSDDLLIIEPVDDAGRPVPAGERSAKVYLTNLYNRTMPLIRYEITDEVTMLPEPCGCGSTHRRVADVQGRLDDVFDYRGIRVHPHLFRAAIGQRAAIIEYQVRQTARGADIAVRCNAPVDAEQLGSAIAAALDRLGLPDPQVTVGMVDALDRLGAGKLKRFIPLSAP
jgi:phenylacetate-CoA ligase